MFCHLPFSLLLVIGLISMAQATPPTSPLQVDYSIKTPPSRFNSATLTVTLSIHPNFPKANFPDVVAHVFLVEGIYAANLGNFVLVESNVLEWNGSVTVGVPVVLTTTLAATADAVGNFEIGILAYADLGPDARTGDDKGFWVHIDDNGNSSFGLVETTARDVFENPPQGREDDIVSLATEIKPPTLPKTRGHLRTVLLIIAVLVFLLILGFFIIRRSALFRSISIWLILSIGWVLTVSASQQTSPLQVDYRIAAAPSHSSSETLTVTLSTHPNFPNANFPNVFAHVFLAEGIYAANLGDFVLVEPNVLEWNGSVTVGVPVVLTTTLAVTAEAEGNYEIGINAYAVLGPDARTGDDTGFWVHIDEQGNSRFGLVETTARDVFENPPQGREDDIVSLATELQGPAAAPAQAPSCPANHICVSGQVKYRDRDGTEKPAKQIRVELWDSDRGSSPSDPGSSTLLASTVTDDAGHYEFPPVLNDDGLFQSGYDIYVLFMPENNAIEVHPYEAGLADLSRSYFSYTRPHDNVPDGAFDMGTHLIEAKTVRGNNLGAFWIHQDLFEAYQRVLDCGHNLTPLAQVVWRSARPNSEYDAPNRTLHIAHRHEWSKHDIIHEFGHYVMHDASGFGSTVPGQSHHFCESIDKQIAWDEGWPTYFALAVTGTDTLIQSQSKK